MECRRQHFGVLPSMPPGWSSKSFSFWSLCDKVHEPCKRWPVIRRNLSPPTQLSKPRSASEPAIRQFERVTILQALESRAEAIIAEASQLGRDDFLAWPQPGAYSGDWSVFPFLVGPHGEAGFDGEETRAAVARNRGRCPATWAALEGLPCLLDAGYSRMEPGTHVYPHADDSDIAANRLHLGLIVPDEGCLFRHDGEIRGWEVGHGFFFDGRVMHEAANLSGAPRTVLICDFDPNPSC